MTWTTDDGRLRRPPPPNDGNHPSIHPCMHGEKFRRVAAVLLLLLLLLLLLSLSFRNRPGEVAERLLRGCGARWGARWEQTERVWWAAEATHGTFVRGVGMELWPPTFLCCDGVGRARMMSVRLVKDAVRPQDRPAKRHTDIYCEFARTR